MANAIKDAKTGTVRLHRVLKAPPERVYRAFTDAGALCKWLPPHGFTGTMHSMDVRVGGGYRMSFTNLTTGKSHSFTVKYLEIVPNERLLQTDSFDDPGMPGEMRVTITFRGVSGGTELIVVQEGIPAFIPVDMCYLGWQDSLQLLGQLVDPEIPDHS